MAIYIDGDVCKGCGLCLYYCSKKVFEITDQVNRKGFNIAGAVRPQDCNSCRLCEMTCPDLAIHVEEKPARERA